MASKAITVTWDSTAKGPTAPDLTLTKDDGASTITWTAGSNISNITISGLDSLMFTGFSGQGTNTVSCTDQNSNVNNKDYSYTIAATHTSGATAFHDPKIINGSRGTPPLRPSPRVPEAEI